VAQLAERAAAAARIAREALEAATAAKAAQPPPASAPLIADEVERAVRAAEEHEELQRRSSIRKLPTYLNVPSVEKGEAQALGAQWDASYKRWYVPAGRPVLPLAQWLPAAVATAFAAAVATPPPTEPAAPDTPATAKSAAATTTAECRRCQQHFTPVNYSGPNPTCFPCRKGAAKASKPDKTPATTAEKRLDERLAARFPLAPPQPAATESRLPRAAVPLAVPSKPPVFNPPSQPTAIEPSLPRAAVPPAAPSLPCEDDGLPPYEEMCPEEDAAPPQRPPPPPPPPQPASSRVFRDCSKCGEPAWVSPKSPVHGARCVCCAGKDCTEEEELELVRHAQEELVRHAMQRAAEGVRSGRRRYAPMAPHERYRSTSPTTIKVEPPDDEQLGGSGGWLGSAQQWLGGPAGQAAAAGAVASTGSGGGGRGGRGVPKKCRACGVAKKGHVCLRKE
jgi:hypothetical protein